MTLDQIIKLLDAGYTKADIEAMQAPVQPAAAAEPEPQKDPEPAQPEQAKPEEKKPVTEPVNNEMLQELRDLKKAVFAMNIMQSSQPAQPESVDDILAKALKEG